MSSRSQLFEVITVSLCFFFAYFWLHKYHVLLSDFAESVGTIHMNEKPDLAKDVMRDNVFYYNEDMEFSCGIFGISVGEGDDFTSSEKALLRKDGNRSVLTWNDSPEDCSGYGECGCGYCDGDY